jgi:hypothetical protein
MPPPTASKDRQQAGLQAGSWQYHPVPWLQSCHSKSTASSFFLKACPNCPRLGQHETQGLRRNLRKTSVLRFVEFLRQRKVDGRVIAKHVLALEKVLRWLRASAAPAYSDAQEKQHSQQMTYTLRLKYQLGMTSNPKHVDPVELRKQGKWLDGPELLAVIERTCQSCIDLIQVIGLPPDGHILAFSLTCCA